MPQENTKQVIKQVAHIVLGVRRVKHHRRAPMKQAIATFTLVHQESIFLARAVKIAQQAHTKQIRRQLNQIANHACRVKHHHRAPRQRLLATLLLAQQDSTPMGAFVTIV